MREGRPSFTASCVAFARAAAGLRDPIAGALFPWPRSYVGRTLARVLTLGLVDHIALRSAVIDEALGTTFPQVVLLGAGLDARAYRLPLENVFEVDHPSSQALKLRRVRDLVLRARSVHHVAADFTKDDVADLLAAAGHDVKQPTAWVLEGLTPYLARSVTELLLAVADKRSAPGSLIAITYMRPLHPVTHAISNAGLRVIGEPLGASYTRDEIARLLQAAGFAVRSDTSGRGAFRVERFAIATR